MKTEFFKNKRKKRIFIWLTSLTAVFVLIIAACGIYVNDYYRADADAINAFTVSASIRQTALTDGTIVFEPENPEAALIFYPGGKVEYTAYIPLMRACAEKNIICFLVEMPFNLAVLDINAADGIRRQYPNIENWYIGGHSLGGSMAASYLESHANEFNGLILLGSYSTADLSSTELKVLSVYGSEDKVMNREKYNANITNLPQNFTETVIDGGCHAYFGVYGKQKGDGTPTVTAKEQILLTAEEIEKFVK
ncbi:MAG: alpha/beta hydrolase [Ruminococcaceae bacterium]|nr:alpha/beta hydrolase [Oscillospiraceae bacterium]MBQ3597711.1 alpha/beta hydrolase [Clostridia bacterium]MBR2915660.1 alpha/beta hydrolase [Clostridia bacterium]